MGLATYILVCCLTSEIPTLTSKEISSSLPKSRSKHQFSHTAFSRAKELNVAPTWSARVSSQDKHAMKVLAPEHSAGASAFPLSLGADSSKWQGTA